MKHFTLLVASVIVMLLIFSVGCKKEDAADPFLKNWRLTYLEKPETHPVVLIPAPDTIDIYLLFNANNSFEVNSYCNTGSGSYIKDGSYLEIRNFSMTEMYCPNNEPLDWEAIFKHNLALAERQMIDYGVLTIFTTGDYNLRFE